MSQVLTLSRLQKIDLQRDQIQSRLRAIDKILSDNVQVQTARQHHANAAESLRKAHKELQNAEAAVNAQNVKIQETEASLYAGRIHNPKELQDLQKDLAAQKRYLGTLEDQQLNAMMACDDLEAALEQAHRALQEIETSVNVKNSGLLFERTGLMKNWERMEAERQAVTQTIPAELLQNYENLRKKKGGVAVASIIDASCSACGAELTPADCQTARSPSRIFYCPSCGRIVYGG